MERYILAVDIGTSSLKAALIDGNGIVEASARIRFPQSRRDACDWIAAFSEAWATLYSADSPAARALPAAIVVSGNGPTLVPVYQDGSAGPVLLWNYAIDSDRAGGKSDPVAIGPSIFIPRITAYKNLFSDCYDRARWLLSGPEFLIYALTGNAVTILPEPRFERAYWTEGDLASAGLDGSKLAPYVATGTIIGATDNADGIPAIPAGIPVVAGGPDFIVALIGTGTLEPGKACDRAGTSEGLNVCTAERVSHGELRTLPSVMKGLWNASYLLPETGAAFHAWRLESGQNLRGYPEIMAEIQSSPIFPPRGETLHPGRAMVEGIGFSVRKGIAVLARETGYSPVFFLSGGQARNEIWNQMKADITGSTFALTETPDGELMGDAIIGFHAIAHYASLKEASESMVRTRRRYEPDAAKHTLYTEKYLAHEYI